MYMYPVLLELDGGKAITERNGVPHPCSLSLMDGAQSSTSRVTDAHVLGRGGKITRKRSRTRSYGALEVLFGPEKFV